MERRVRGLCRFVSIVCILVFLLITISTSICSADFNIKPIATYDTDSAYDVAVSGNYVYIADYDNGLVVVDVTSPVSAKMIGVYDTDGYPMCIAISDNYAYVCCDNDDGNAFVDIFSLTNPSSPKLTGRLNLGYRDMGLNDIYVNNKYVYIAQGFSGFDIIDVSNPSSPKMKGYYSPLYEASNFTCGVSVSANYAYVVNVPDLGIFDISNPASPKPVGSYNPGWAEDIALLDKYIYMTTDTGLVILDITNPISPKPKGKYNIDNARDITVVGKYAYIASNSGLIILDVSSPSSPTIVGSYNTFVNSFAVSGGYIYALPDGDLTVLHVEETQDTTLPSPEITSVVIEPSTGVYEGDTATIKVSVKNNGGLSKEGYISVSFPNNENEIEVSGTGNEANKLYPVGSTVYTSTGTMVSVNPLAELQDSNWVNGQTETLTIKVKPNAGSSKIEFYVRSALKDDSGNFVRTPLSSADKDQQGWYVNRHSIDVLKATSKTLFVDDSGGQTYTTIQAALDDANDGDTILVYPGTYNEEVSIDKKLKILSQSGASVTKVETLDLLGVAFNVNADDVTISGFDISGFADGQGIYVDGQNCIISNNIVHNIKHGIDLGRGSSNNKVTSNTVYGTEYGIIAGNSNSIFASNNVYDNDFGFTLGGSNNQIYGNYLANIEYNAFDDGNNVWDNGQKGNYYSDYQGIDANSDGIGDTPYYIQGGSAIDHYPLMKTTPTNLVVEVLSPSDSFVVTQYAKTLVKAKVTDNLGNSMPGSRTSLVQATFTNGDSLIQLFDDGAHNDENANDGIYANEWTPTTVSTSSETACTITVSARHSTLEEGTDETRGIIQKITYDPKIIVPVSVPYAQTAYIGTELTFKFNIKNNGNGKDTIKLNVNDSYNWGSSLSKNNVDLSAGEETEINLSIILKEDGKINRYTVEASSLNDATKKDLCYFTVGAQNVSPLIMEMTFENSVDKNNKHTLNFNAEPYVKIQRKSMTLPGDSQGGVNAIIFDPDSSSAEIHSFEIEVNDVTTNEKTILPIKINESCKIFATDYDVTRDSYNFSNWGGVWYLLNKGMSGHCYGISTTDILFYEKMYNIEDFSSNAHYIYDLKRNDVEKLIKAHQNDQNLILYQMDQIKENRDEQSEYSKLKDNISNGNPMVLGGNFTGLHAIVAYKIVEVDDEAFILWYDNNQPYKPSNFKNAFPYGKLSLDTWELHFDLSKHDPIDFVVLKPSVLSNYDQYVFECPVNVTIEDTFGKVTSDNGVNEIPNSTVIMINDTKIFHVPHQGSYQIIIDAYDNGTFNFTRVSPSDSEISISECVNIPVTPSTMAFATVDQKNTSYTLKLDKEGDGIIDQIYSPTVVSFGVSAEKNPENDSPDSSSSGSGGGSSSSSKSSSGGGGGAGSVEDFANVAVKDVANAYLMMDANASYQFTKEGNPIQSISLYSLKNSGEITSTIEVLNNRSKLVNSTPEGSIYKYVNIWVGKSGFATAANIKDAKVRFKVNSSWAEEMDVNPADVKLQRYNGTSWEILPTVVESNTSGYVIFEAHTPGFSPFAITAEKELAAPISSDTGTKSSPSEDVGMNGTQLEKTPGFGFSITILMIGAFAGWYVYLKKRLN